MDCGKLGACSLDKNHAYQKPVPAAGGRARYGMPASDTGKKLPGAES